MALEVKRQLNTKQKHKESHFYFFFFLVKKWNLGRILFIFIHSRINSKSQRTPTEFGLSVVSLANLQKRSEALARYYVTLHCQAEWAKKRRWKKIESPSPSPPSPPPATTICFC